MNSAFARPMRKWLKFQGELQYATNESLTPEELKELFLSIRWFSGHYSPKT